MATAKINVPLLKELSEANGVSGFEGPIREIVKREIEGLVDEMYTDKMGNLIALKKGKSDKKVMICAHMDEIGFMVKYIDDNGFVHFDNLGGFDPKTLTAQRVVIHGKKDLVGVMGCKPIHMMSPEERKTPPKIEKYYIDLGMPKKEVEKYIEIGNPITRERELIEMGDMVNGKSLDNRVSVFILIEALKKMKKSKVPYDVYATFTTQEEVGLRGAKVATHGVQPDIGIGLDTTIAFDTPGSSPVERCTTLGEGTAVKCLDGSAISSPELVDCLKKIADKKRIKYQLEVMKVGGTDTGALQMMAAEGCIAGGISIPTRNLHQVVEMAHKDDIQATIDLLTAFCENADQCEWIS